MNAVSACTSGTTSIRSRFSLLKVSKPSLLGTSSAANAPGMSCLLAYSNMGSSCLKATSLSTNANSA